MTLLWILLGVLALLLIAVCTVTICLYRFGLSRRPFPRSRVKTDVWSTPPKMRMGRDGQPYDPYGWKDRIREADMEMFEIAQAAERWTIRSHDGLTLAARYLPPKAEAVPRAIVLMVHGYRSTPMNDFSCGAYDMRAMGLGCLLIEHRAHLTSEGDTITFGVMERHDVVGWARYLKEKFPDTPVILDGISMGASTVMMSCALDLPDNVRGIVADCGFTSMDDMFRRIIGEWFHLPAWPFIPLASLYCRLKNGFGFADVSAQDALLNAKVPVLLAHGTGDTFVPFEMGERIYETVRDKIDVTFIRAEGAEHGLSYLCEHDAYRREIERLVEKVLK